MGVKEAAKGCGSWLASNGATAFFVAIILIASISSCVKQNDLEDRASVADANARQALHDAKQALADAEEAKDQAAAAEARLDQICETTDGDLGCQ
jgi:hypothetical protein